MPDLLSPGAMASIADSEVMFVSRAKQYGLAQEMVDSLAATGIKTYSGLLFAVASAPAAVDKGRLKAAHSKHSCTMPSEGTLSAFSRLPFEAGTIVIAELRSSVAGEDDGSRCKFTHQERSSRMAAMRAKLGAWPSSDQGRCE